MLSRGERVKNGVQEQLAKIVDGVGYKRRDAEVVGTRLGVVVGQCFEVNTSEIEESILVIGGEVVFSLYG